MSKKIVTYDDLLEEKKRLETLLPVRKQRMRADWDEVKLEFVPIQNAVGSVGNFFKRDKSNPLLNMGINFAGDVIFKRLLLAKADWVTRLILPIFLKNYSSHVFKPSKIKNVLSRFRTILTRKKSDSQDIAAEYDPSTPESMQY